MIWINIKELESKISRNELTEKDSFNYLLATLILSIVSILLPTINGLNYESLIHVLLSVIITVLCLCRIYRLNEKADNKDFLKRLISINWVVRVRLTIYYLIFTFIYIQFFSLSDSRGLALVIFSFLLNVLFYYFSIQSFKRLRTLIERNR
jgi:uncharacterized membrane protein